MGKISPVVAKYIIHIPIQIDGVVEKPDVIGAIFGQTEGLLGSDLELRELQRSGRIGRIEVNIETRSGKSSGYIIIPSSLDKAETAIIAAAFETIQRIGPCDSRVKVEKIEDVRISKRNYVVERAKELLKNLTEAVLPDSQEITDEVAQSVRMMEIIEYGGERLPAGPDIDSSEEIILVEGRADVLNLLKHGIKNVIGLNGTSIPETVKELCKQKVVTLFVDGDRGGDIIIKGLVGVTELDYVTKAPDGKEVEELTKKEIHKALRSRIAMEQIKPDIARAEARPEARQEYSRKVELPKKEKLIFKEMLDKLLGTRGAYLLDKDLKILGKVPINEVTNTIRSLGNVYAIVLDGVVDWELAKTAERINIKYLIAAASKVNSDDVKVEILTNRELL
ncbi:MAG: DNA primase DnaG [Nanoarchaeota archaeon]